MSRNDIPELPRDPALTPLDWLFPDRGAPAAAAELAAAVAGTALPAQAARVQYARYKPAKDCVAQWSFATPSGTGLLVSGKLFHDDKGGEIVARASFRRLAEEARISTGSAAPLFRYLSDERALLQAFPLDSKLPGLARAASPAWLAQALAPAMGAGAGTLRVLEASPLRYKAWHRCVLRYRVELRGAERVLYGKVFRDGRGEAMPGHLSRLRAELEANGVPWLVPEAVVYLSEARLLLLAALDHHDTMPALLERAVDDPGARASLLERVRAAAEGLLGFQRLELTGLPVVTAAAELDWLGGKARGIAQVAPGLGRAIAGRLERLVGEAALLPEEPLVLAHGAFRHSQLLLCGERLGLIDLDGLRRSGQGADAGEFLGYLDRMALRRPRYRGVVAAARDAFELALQGRVDPRWLAWHRAATHVKWAIRSFHSLKRDASSEELLSLAEGALGTPVGAAGVKPC